MADWDVLIVGGGIAGASIGAELAGRRRVLLIEAEEQCGYHSTGRSAAFWLESYGGAEVAKLTRASRTFLADPPPDFADRPFLIPRGAVHIARSGWPELPESVAARRIDRAELERLVPGILPSWRHALYEENCADIDVAALHAAYLKRLRTTGGSIRTSSSLHSARRGPAGWRIDLANGETIEAQIIVNAAGAWADQVAERCGVRPLAIAPKRRTMVQLRIGRRGLRPLPLVADGEGSFYFKGESDCSVWLSPHDEIATEPCDAAPEEIDIATAIDRFEQVVDWPIERVERSWAGLRSFAPDRLPVLGFDSGEPSFFWCAGQGGFGIQTAPAAARLSADLILGRPIAIDDLDPASFSPARFDT